MFTEKQLNKYADTYNCNSQELTREKKNALGFNESALYWDLVNILHHLNYRWSIDALALSKGDKAPFELYQIYEPYKKFISLDTLAQIDRLRDEAVKIRLKHSLIDHYLAVDSSPMKPKCRPG